MEDTLPEYDYIFKFLLSGRPGAGKSSFLLRYCENYFTDQYISTIGVDFKIKTIKSPDTGKNIKVQIWDIAGQQKFKTVTSSYYRGAHGILVMFDSTERECSFKGVPALFEEIEKHARDTIQLILVATKVDLVDQRQVSYEEAKQLADHFGVPYIETSSKNNININEAIDILVRNVETVLQQEEMKSAANPPPTLIQPKTPPGTSRCLIM